MWIVPKKNTGPSFFFVSLFTWAAKYVSVIRLTMPIRFLSKSWSIIIIIYKQIPVPRLCRLCTFELFLKGNYAPIALNNDVCHYSNERCQQTHLLRETLHDSAETHHGKMLIASIKYANIKKLTDKLVSESDWMREVHVNKKRNSVLPILLDDDRYSSSKTPKLFHSLTMLMRRM